jgi:hypothetical protein
MCNLCEQVIQSARYLESEGISQEQLSQLHHFALNDRQLAFRAIYRYFGTHKQLRSKNVSFAERLKFVADEHKTGKKSINTLIKEALRHWPLQ